MREGMDGRIADVQPFILALIDGVDILQMLEEPEHAPGLPQLRGGMIASDEDHRDPRFREPQQLLQRQRERAVGRPDGIEKVAGVKNEVRSRLERQIDELDERVVEVHLPQVQAARLIDLGEGREAQMRVGDVDDPHCIAPRVLASQWG